MFKDKNLTKLTDDQLEKVSGGIMDPLIKAGAEWGINISTFSQEEKEYLYNKLVEWDKDPNRTYTADDVYQLYEDLRK